MLNFLRKDILVQKHNLWFLLGYSIFVFVVFSNEIFSPFVYIMGAVVLSYVMIMAAVQSEYKSNSDLAWLSLPVKRQEVVASKYVGVLMFILVSLAIMGLTGSIFKLSPLPYPTRFMNWQDVTITLVSVILMISLYLPAYYKLGNKWLQAINVALFLVIFFAPSTIANYLGAHQQDQGVQWLVQTVGENPHLSSLLGIACVAGLMLISFLISMNIYKKQDF